MEVAEVDDSLISSLETYLKNDIANLYLLYDLYNERNRRAKFYVAMKGSDILGVVLIYDGYPYRSAWILGARKAAVKLLELARLDKGIIWATEDVQDLVEDRFAVSNKYRMDVMTLDTSKANPMIKHDVQRLSGKDAYPWAQSILFSQSGKAEDPTEEDIRRAEEFLKENIAFGVYHGSLLASRGAAYVRLGEAWNVGAIFTHPKHRSRGLATSVTSALVKEAQRHTGKMMLFVQDNNILAKRVYGKIGLRADGGRRIYLDLVQVGRPKDRIESESTKCF